MSNVRSFYSHHEIELPKLPPFQLDEYVETYEDIPTKEDIQAVIEYATNTQYKAIILFMISSGSARNETMNLTIEQFIDATKDYHNSTKIDDVLNELEKQDDIIPLWKMYRPKTNTPYYTCNSPECTTAFIQHIRKEKLHNNDKIFNILIDSVNQTFRNINLKMGWDEKKTIILIISFHTVLESLMLQ